MTVEGPAGAPPDESGNERIGLAYRPDLQGLRALAIALVVLAHAGVPGLSGGFVGVDLFFVLSGYLITGLLLRERASTGRIRFAAFIARRLKRLLPALLGMLLLVTLAGMLLLSAHEFNEQTASVAYAATWTSNLYFAFTTFDYFAELHLRDLYLHTWSLGVEEQFYLVWPLLLTAGYAVAGRPGAPLRRRLLIGAGAVFAASLALSLYWSMTQTLWAFYLMPARFWQFALGAMVFIRFQVGAGGEAPVRGPAAWLYDQRLGLGLIACGALLIGPDRLYPGLWALLPSIGAALVIASGCAGPERRGPDVLSHASLVWLGDRSYSLYLWHWPLLMLGFAWGLEGNAVATAALAALSLLLAMASYRWVELPFWKGRFSRTPVPRIFAYAIACIVVLTVGAVQLGALTRDHRQRTLEFARAVRADVPPVYRMGCDSWFKDARVEPCVLGDRDAKRTVVLLGDSVGAHWFSLLPEVFGPSGWKIILLTKSACAMVDEDYVYAVAGGVYRVCSDWRNRVLDYLATLRPDTVFVGSASTYGFSETQWVQGSRRVFERLSGAARRVIVIPGTPKLTFDGPGCLARRLADNPSDPLSDRSACREAVAGKPAQRVTPYLARAAEGLPNVAVLDLNDLVCPGGTCAARNGDGPVVFRDQRHLTDSFVRAQAQAFARRLDRLQFPPD